MAIWHWFGNEDLFGEIKLFMNPRCINPFSTYFRRALLSVYIVVFPQNFYAFCAYQRKLQIFLGRDLRFTLTSSSVVVFDEILVLISCIPYFEVVVHIYIKRHRTWTNPRGSCWICRRVFTLNF